MAALAILKRSEPQAHSYPSWLDRLYVVRSVRTAHGDREARPVRLSAVVPFLECVTSAWVDSAGLLHLDYEG